VVSRVGANYEVLVWDMTPCYLIEKYRRLGGTCCLCLQIFFFQTTRHHILECSNLRVTFLLVTLPFNTVSFIRMIYMRLRLGCSLVSSERDDSVILSLPI
jgi:hypothetical protein